MGETIRPHIRVNPETGETELAAKGMEPSLDKQVKRYAKNYGLAKPEAYRQLLLKGILEAKRWQEEGSIELRETIHLYCEECGENVSDIVPGIYSVLALPTIKHQDEGSHAVVGGKVGGPEE